MTVPPGLPVLAAIICHPCKLDRHKILFKQKLLAYPKHSLCNALQRPGDNTTGDYPKALVSEDGQNGIEVQYTKLQLLLDEVVCCEPDTNSPETPPENNLSTQESTIRFNVQLQDLDTTMPPEMQDISM